MRPHDVVAVEFNGVTQTLPRAELVRLAMAKRLRDEALALIPHHVNDRGRHVDLESNPQFQQIHADPSPDMVIQAAAQTGKTLFGVIRAIAGLRLGLAVGMVFPKDDDRNRFVHEKWEETVKNTDLYKVAVGDSNSVKLKKMWDNGILHLVGCNSDTNLRAFSADMMGVDEYDHCDPEFRPLFRTRMNRSPYRLTFKISTPTLPGDPPEAKEQVDNINTQLLAGTHYQYHSLCGACGEQQVLTWDDHVVRYVYDEAGNIIDFHIRDKEWEPGGSRDIRPICRRCRAPIDRARPGLWIPRRPGAAVASYEVNRINTPMGQSLAELAGDCREALGDATKMQVFVNMGLGGVFKGGAQAFTDALFRGCVLDGYRMRTVEKGLGEGDRDGLILAGLDVNVPFFDLHISQWRLENGVPHQRKLHCAKVQGRKEVYALLRRFEVRGLVMDQKPELHLAQEMRDELAEEGITAILSQTSPHGLSKPWIESEKDESSDLPTLISIDGTACVDAFRASMVKRTVTWFENWSTVLEGALAIEMKKPVRQRVVGDAGRVSYKWVGKPDHQLWAAVFDHLAGQLMRGRLVSLGRVLIRVADHTHRRPMAPRGPRQKVDPMLLQMMTGQRARRR